ncbi:MAG: nitroreductase family protein [Christensenellales bacterium]|jgi:nitroreductase
MDLFQAVTERYSYRGMYLPDPVPREDLTRILEAGLAAPSGCNQQTTSLIALDDPAVIGPVGALLNKPHFASAPAAVCVLTQRIIAYGDSCFSAQDYGAAIENMLLAITALGYASCWVEGHVTAERDMNRRMRELLAVPEGYELVAYLPVGKPVAQGPRVRKKPFDQRAWFNRFGGQ